jgi:hypothetical protein
VSDQVLCKNCGWEIRPINWALGPGWAHYRNNKPSSRCDNATSAAPPDDYVDDRIKR